MVEKSGSEVRVQGSSVFSCESTDRGAPNDQSAGELAVRRQRFDSRHRAGRRGRSGALARVYEWGGRGPPPGDRPGPLLQSLARTIVAEGRGVGSRPAGPGDPVRLRRGYAAAQG